MGYALEPGQVLAHYRVIGPLGAGGMGEVYLAEDQALGRKVALKVLPPALVTDPQRLHRFGLEARSASSLNHPNIVTIHEIGQTDDQSGAIHFIAMEYVEGTTLGGKIHAERTDLRTLLTWLAQAAEGLAKAHAAGIVHRDLKPANLMVTNDGFAKVLDFGLAKLTERAGGVGADQATTLPVSGASPSESGAVIGTIGYMSPEQVAGKPVDARADVFSFGCILYEAATRRRPFMADTGVETLHKILSEQPTPIDQINPAVPSELRRVIRRCLAKSPDQRYQSIKDVAIDLREIVDEFDTLSASASSGSAASPAITVPGNRRPMLIALGLVGAVACLLLGVWLAGGWRGPAAPAAGGSVPQSLRITSVISGADLGVTALSDDGRYLAYTRQADANAAVFVRQVSTGSDVQVATDIRGPVYSMRFAPSGDYLYMRAAAADAVGTSTLLVVPSLGGPLRRLASDVDGQVGFSPDGKSIAFIRRRNQESVIRLIALDLEQRTERVVGSVQSVEFLVGSLPPRWSQDGRTVAVAAAATNDPSVLPILAFDVSTGERRVANSWMKVVPNSREWPRMLPASGVWLGTSRLIVAGAPAPEKNLQLWDLDTDRGTRRRLTNDSSSYGSVSVSADGQTLAALRNTSPFSLWAAPVAPQGPPRQVPLGVADPSLGAPLSADTLAFVASGGDRSALWTSRTDGSRKRRLSPDTLDVDFFAPVPGTSDLIFRATGADTLSHFWRVGLDGENLRQLTRDGSEMRGDVSPDGRFLLFVENFGERFEMRRLSLDGTESMQRVGDDTPFYGGLSPDGKWFVQWRFSDDPLRHPTQANVFPTAGGAAVASLKVIGAIRSVGWAADASALTYLTSDGPDDVLMRWPLAGGEPTTLLRMAGARIDGRRWSPDRRSLALAVTSGGTMNVWVWVPGGPSARQLTFFPSGEIQNLRWTPDGSALYFSQGTRTVDIVLIRGFE